MFAFNVRIGVLVSLLAYGQSGAATIAVPADQPTVQLAVHAAGPGDTITVAGGHYVEHVLIGGAKSGITIEAADASMPLPVIESDGRGFDVVRVSRAEGVVLRNLILRGGNSGVRLSGARDAVVDGVTVLDCNEGIWVSGGAGNVVTGATIDGARTGRGARIEYTTEMVLEDSVITNSYREGIRGLNSPGLALDDNDVSGSRGGDGILVRYSPNASIQANTSSGNYNSGFRIQNTPDAVITDNDAHHNRHYGYLVEHSPPITSPADLADGWNAASDNRLGSFRVQ